MDVTTQVAVSASPSVSSKSWNFYHLGHRMGELFERGDVAKCGTFSVGHPRNVSRNDERLEKIEKPLVDKPTPKPSVEHNDDEEDVEDDELVSDVLAMAFGG